MINASMHNPFETPPSPPVSSITPVQPVGDAPPLDPTLWGAEILGMFGAADMFYNRYLTSTDPGEQFWLQNQFNTIVDELLPQAQALANANPGSLSPALLNFLNNGVAQLKKPLTGLGTWLATQEGNLDGTGMSVTDWFTANMATEKPIVWEGSSNQPNLMNFAYYTSFLFIQGDTSGQFGFDNYFGVDLHNPFASNLNADEVLTFSVWQQSGSPQPGSAHWSTFATNLGYMETLLNPSNTVPASTATNYNTYFWAAFQEDVDSVNNGQLPDGDTFDSALESFFQTFNQTYTGN